jgi:hypothetical protein
MIIRYIFNFTKEELPVYIIVFIEASLRTD